MEVAHVIILMLHKALQPIFDPREKLLPHNFESIAKSCKFHNLALKLAKTPSVWALAFDGSLNVEDLATANKYFDAFFAQASLPGQIEFDLSALQYLDSNGAFLLYNCVRQAKAKNIELALKGLKPEHQRIYHLLDPQKLEKQPLVAETRRSGFLETLGSGTYDMVQDAYQIIDYFGRIMALFLRTLLKPQTMRWPDMFYQMQQVGVGGLPIVGLIGLLLGLILAFMSIMQLEPFGASIYVASLVSVAMIKELGPIMTAIVVAGRSGSAFAAEIGSMKENEELDALAVMGYDPIMFLAMPRVLAAVLVVPILFVFSSLFGIIGGLIIGIVGIGLDIHTYLNYTISSLNVDDFIVSFVKTMIFAFLIAGVGCQRGFSVRGGASAVGKATTSSVVISIFIIIVIDSIFAVVQQYAWW